MSSEAKCPRSAGSRRSPPLNRLELVTIAHVASLILIASWAFGGNSPGARLLLSWWGSLGVLVLLDALRESPDRHPVSLRPLRWLIPLALFNVAVIASAFNPSFRAVADGLQTVYVEDHARLPLPSSARPLLSLQALWFFDAVYLSCFNLALIIRQRRALRLLLLVAVANAMLLAVFGTVQKLMQAPGLFFGLVKSPQPRFFASFIYANHWGAFTLLMTAAAVGLVFHFARRSESRDFWHSPAFAGLAAILFLAASAPLSGSRSGTVLLLLLLVTALFHGFARTLRRRRTFRESAVVPIAGMSAVVLIAGFLIFALARPVIDTRLANTREQLAEVGAGQSSRAILYRDTWHMALEKPWFGWGMGSYPTVFFHRNTQVYPNPDGLPHYYHDAHSDWLQSLAEVGFVGSILLGLCAALPLYARRRVLARSPISLYLLAGCGLLVLYAWLEFPFGNRGVVVTFWLCFFTAVHYGRLESSDPAPV